MNDIRSISDINKHMHSLLMSVATVVIFTLAIFVYPIIHIVYINRSYKLMFPMFVCITVLVLVVFGPFYGWLSSMK